MKTSLGAATLEGAAGPNSNAVNPPSPFVVVPVLHAFNASKSPSEAPNPATLVEPRFALSIKTKGLIVFAALIAYSVLIASFAFHQKNLLLGNFEEIQHALEAEAMLKQADVSTFHAVMTLFSHAETAEQAAGIQRIQIHRLSLMNRYAAISARLPGAALPVDRLNEAWEEAYKVPSESNQKRLTVELLRTKNDLAVLTEKAQEFRKSLSEHYRKRTNSVAATTFLFGMLGLGLLGAIIGVFFRRLTDDLSTLQGRALEIVKGFRGEPIAITRDDEVGQLMMAVNNMAETLDQREKEVMLERQKYFHQEKMAAIGALAAGVSHEIGNPIAAISGISQDMVERRAATESGLSKKNCHDCRPDLIYVQTQRLAAITREISEFASPRAAEPQLLDLNAQLRSTSSLVRFDKRLQHVTLRLELDSQLPAIYGVADQLTQMVMNLLINAMDALEIVQTGRTPTIVISTRADAERACIVIEDNGQGIEPEILSRVFDPFFTTKAAGRGTGLGLSLCYSITKKHGGTIEIDSTLGVGTRVQVFFPLNETAYNEANFL